MKITIGRVLLLLFVTGPAYSQEPDKEKPRPAQQDEPKKHQSESRAPQAQDRAHEQQNREQEKQQRGEAQQEVLHETLWTPLYLSCCNSVRAPRPDSASSACRPPAA